MSDAKVRALKLPEGLWQRDQPLCRAAELLDRLGGQIRAVSFDFFDTLVWRLVNRPTDVFTEVGTRLSVQGSLRSPISHADYGTLRRHAEHLTRERQGVTDSKCEDIKLAAIYNNMGAVLPEPASAAQLELAVEQEVCWLNPGVVDFIHYLRGRGLRILILSDIYFSAEQLRGILAANGLDAGLFELILTSADAGLCKGTGNLFKKTLKEMRLKPGQMLHIGDNYLADVLGARKAGIRACHYPQATAEVRTILDREQVLLGGQVSTYNANSARMLAARYFQNGTEEGFFGQMGALLMGPLMTRFASWACQQYLNAGVRKVGAFMREGDLFAKVLQREAEAKKFDLTIEPLFINRKATDLAALGKLTAAGLLDWLERRCTLKIKNILKHFGLSAEELRRLPFALDEKADTNEKILKLAEYLFTPAIARRIEQKSAEERAKVMDYLRPWLEGGTTLGLCDLGYSASAQSQLHRILAMEQNPTKLLGCYLVTYEKAASRVLEGMDIRHFLGAFGKPDYFYRTFLRSPAFIEQALVAPIGTTLGYERQADGSVTPVLDQTQFDPGMLRKQKAFKDGVLLFQNLWLSFDAAKPGLLDGTTELSRRILADVDANAQPILARATGFPLSSELTHFGSLPLDDYYFDDAMKPMCSPSDREALRQKGYAGILGDAGTYWPQGVHALENPRSNSEFFSYARTFMLCNPERDNDGVQPDLTIFVRALRDPAALRGCLERLLTVSNPALRIELVVGVMEGSKEPAAVAREFSRRFHRFRVGEMTPTESVNKYLNGAADDSAAPFILFLQENSVLPAGWDKILVEPMQISPEIAAVSPIAHCLAVRRAAFIEALGFQETLSPDAAAAKLFRDLADLKWQTQPSSRNQAVNVDWIGPFSDYGSLAQVNRASVRALETLGDLQLNGGGAPAVTVRHQWPPDWSRPKQGALVVIQPWEFGALPRQWVQAAAGVDEFWLPSNYVRQVYIDSGIPSGKIAVIPNGVDLAHYHPGVTPLELATRKKFRFLFVGGTIARKGPDVLLKAFLDAFTAADDVCLVIKDFGGDSVYQGQTFEKGIEAARLRPNAPEILYLNRELSPADMPRLFAACQCLVHPYRGEGFAMPVLEAMACGLPVVVTQGGATDDFVSPDAGWLIPAQRKSLGPNIGAIPLAADGWWLEPDADYLTGKLKHICVNTREARDRGARGAKIALNYSWEHIAQQMKARLQHIAAASPTKAPFARCLAKIATGGALIGHLGSAREALERKDYRKAWSLTLAALETRPFHPEAWLMLSRIAAAVGAGDISRRCLDHARKMAPRLKANVQIPRTTSSPEWLQAPEARPIPRLTVCLIAKNEEQFLESCLQSVREIASQIIVVDTGSIDRTVEIAKKFNAEVHSFVWNDDFSAARNEALKHATGDWVLSLDADEELLPEHLETILREIKEAGVMGYRLPIIDAGREQEGSSYVPRLFRNAPGLFFVGRVHEQIFSSIEVRAKEWGLENRLGKAALLHHGYKKEVVADRNKVARNLRLLRMAINELPDEPNLIMNLGLELIRSGELENGLAQYAEALKLMAAMPRAQIVPELRETLLTQFTSHLLTAKRFSEMIQLWRNPFCQADGMTASQHFMLGLAHMELQQLAPAAKQMRQCLARRGQPVLSPIHKEILGAGPHHCLAMCLASLEKPEEAAQAFRDAIAHDANSRLVRFDFARFQFRQHQPVEALTLLNKLIAENPSDLPAWQLGGEIALSRIEFLEFARNWSTEAVKHFPENAAILLQRAEVLTLTGEVELALPLWADAHAPNSARRLAVLILCELVQGAPLQEIPLSLEKPVSQEFLKWYRRLIAFNATTVVTRCNEKLAELLPVLPTAAEILAAAMKRAEEAVAA